MGCSEIICEDDGKWEAEEDEALSLCDLPVNLTKEERTQTKNEEDGEEPQALKTDEDFNFGSLCGSLSTELEMCAADEVFFQGQILPLRLSVSSDSGLTGWCRQDSLNTSRCLSSYTKNIQFQFKANENQKQLQHSSKSQTPYKIVQNSSHQCQQPNPEIIIDVGFFQDSNKGSLGKRIGSFSGCKCSVDAIGTVPLNNVIMTKSSKDNAAMEDKKKLLQELKTKKKRKGKQALSRNRTFEWLTELSHASYVDGALKKHS
ncbi:hypothetical protein GOBAR_DD18881 [Gossypium barbadense]|nr:hypothetical protein GOBAR_DD18881 [Gossypium barbadense]